MCLRVVIKIGEQNLYLWFIQEAEAAFPFINKINPLNLCIADILLELHKHHRSAKTRNLK